MQVKANIEIYSINTSLSELECILWGLHLANNNKIYSLYFKTLAFQMMVELTFL